MNQNPDPSNTDAYVYTITNEYSIDKIKRWDDKHKNALRMYVKDNAKSDPDGVNIAKACLLQF